MMKTTSASVTAGTDVVDGKRARQANAMQTQGEERRRGLPEVTERKCAV